MAEDQKKYDVDEIRKSHAKAYAKWAAEDDSRLAAMFRSQVSVAEMAREFGRNEGAVTSRLRKLGLDGLLHNPDNAGNSKLELPANLKLGCSQCESDFELASSVIGNAQLWCSNCRCLLSDLDPTPFKDVVEQEAEGKRRLQESGELRTRIQTSQQDDAGIDKDGMFAEIAATLLLCPSRLIELFECWKLGENNRGRDLPTEWTELPKPVEIKFTRWYSATKGFLLIRPPSKSGHLMNASFVDDAFYLLMTKVGQVFRLVGWADRESFLSNKVIDPVGRTSKQVQCWGVHWSKLSRIDSFPFGRLVFFPSRCSNEVQQKAQETAEIQEVTASTLCITCNAPISSERLEVFPDATMCRECKELADNGQSDAEREVLYCPRCAQNGLRARLVYRQARDPEVRGHFLGCSNFPDCRYTES